MAVWHQVSYRVLGRNRIELIHAKYVDHVTLSTVTSSFQTLDYNQKKEKKRQRMRSPQGYIQLIIDGNCNSFHDVYIMYIHNFGTPSSKKEMRDCAGHELRCWHPPPGLRIDTRTSAFCHFSFVRVARRKTQYAHTMCTEYKKREKRKKRKKNSTSFIRRWWMKIRHLHHHGPLFPSSSSFYHYVLLYRRPR